MESGRARDRQTRMMPRKVSAWKRHFHQHSTGQSKSHGRGRCPRGTTNPPKNGKEVILAMCEVALETKEMLNHAMCEVALETKEMLNHAMFEVALETKEMLNHAMCEVALETKEMLNALSESPTCSHRPS